MPVLKGLKTTGLLLAGFIMVLYLAGSLGGALLDLYFIPLGIMAALPWAGAFAAGWASPHKAGQKGMITALIVWGVAFCFAFWFFGSYLTASFWFYSLLWCGLGGPLWGAFAFALRFTRPIGPDDEK